MNYQEKKKKLNLCRDIFRQNKKLILFFQLIKIKPQLKEHPYIHWTIAYFFKIIDSQIM